MVAALNGSRTEAVNVSLEPTAAETAVPAQPAVMDAKVVDAFGKVIGNTVINPTPALQLVPAVPVVPARPAPPASTPSRPPYSQAAAIKQGALKAESTATTPAASASTVAAPAALASVAAAPVPVLASASAPAPVSAPVTATVPAPDPAPVSTPAAPPEPTRFLATTYSDGTKIYLDNAELDTVSVLQRHRGEMNFHVGDIQKKIDDPNTPSDLKEALRKLKDDPTLTHLLDTANRNNGGGKDSGDGYLADSDLDAIGRWDVVKQYNAKQAKTFESNYVSSESGGKDQAARHITDIDARREFYLYSGNLPSNVDENTLHDIVNGNLKGGKAPPQLIAAAQFYLDNPNQWKAMTVHGNKKGDILGVVADNLLMTKAESATIETMKKNRELFLGKVLNREGLREMLKNSGNSAEVKKAAQQLLDDPLLFGVLDNGQRGHVPSRSTRVDDDNINQKDFDGFLNRLTTKGKTAPAPPASRKPTTPVEVKALAAMNAGAKDDPAIKIAMGGGGGGILGFFKSLGKTLAKIGTVVLHVVSIGLSLLDKIPIIGPIFAGLSVAAEAGAGMCNIVKTAFEGGNLKKAAEMLGIGVAGAALGAIIPGMGAAVVKGASAVATKVASSAAGRAVAKAATPMIESVKGTAGKVSAAVSQTTKGVVQSAKTAGSTAANGAKAGVLKGGQQITAAGKKFLDRAGLITVEKDAEKIAEKAAKRAARQENKLAKADDKALKAEEKAAKKRREEEEMDLLQPQQQQYAAGGYFDDISLRMAMQNELQKNLKRSLQASAPDTASQRTPLPLPQVAAR